MLFACNMYLCMKYIIVYLQQQMRKIKTGLRGYTDNWKNLHYVLLLFRWFIYITSTGTCTILGMFLKVIQCNPWLSVTHSKKNTEIVINIIYFAHSSMCSMILLAKKFQLGHPRLIKPEGAVINYCLFCVNVKDNFFSQSTSYENTIVFL